ncbi:MAG: cupin domain-containing protein [Prevotella sp.]|nr:cupin domain-containing protein [Prevotella sp.]
MIIDYDQINEQEIMKFKGGEGLLRTRNFVDEKCKIMMSRLTPGASSGYHQHEGNCEIVMILSGHGHFVYDGTTEPIQSGSVHYCPMGHSHSMHNDSDSEDLVYFAIVPEHH